MRLKISRQSLSSGSCKYHSPLFHRESYSSASSLRSVSWLQVLEPSEQVDESEKSGKVSANFCCLTAREISKLERKENFEKVVSSASPKSNVVLLSPPFVRSVHILRTYRGKENMR